MYCVSCSRVINVFCLWHNSDSLMLFYVSCRVHLKITCVAADKVNWFIVGDMHIYKNCHMSPPFICWRRPYILISLCPWTDDKNFLFTITHECLRDRLDEGLKCLQQEIDFSVQADNYPVVNKVAIAVVLVHLHRGDYVAADQFFKSCFTWV